MTGRTRAPPAEKEAQQPMSPEVDPEADYKAAFQTFAPLNGSITTAQLRQAMADLGETVSDAEIETVMENIDGDEKITCKEKSLPISRSPPSESSQNLSAAKQLSVESSKFELLQFWKNKEMNADHVAVERLQTRSLSILRKVNKGGLMMQVV